MLAPYVPYAQVDPRKKVGNKDKQIRTDPISLAIEARQTRLDDLKRLGIGALIPDYIRYRVPEGKLGRGMAQYAPKKECTCRKCERFRIESTDPKVAVCHMATIPHLAQEFEVSPFDLARAIRGIKVMNGIDPDAGKRKPKKRGRWNTRMKADQSVRYASQMLAKWQKRNEQAKMKCKTWAKRLTAATLAQEKDTQ